MRIRRGATLVVPMAPVRTRAEPRAGRAGGGRPARPELPAAACGGGGDPAGGPPPCPPLPAAGVATPPASRAPALYRQRRVGKDGVPFELWKRRTMVPDTEGMGAGSYVL